MRQNMDMNFEQTLTIIFSVLFPQSLWHFCGAHKTEKMNAFNKKILRFLLPFLVSSDFVWWLLLTGLSWIPYACGCAACLILWLHLLHEPFLMLISVVDRFKLYFTRSCFYLLSRSSKK